MNSNIYGTVNGQSCSYVKLGTYSNCANAEKRVEKFEPGADMPKPVSSVTPNYTPKYTVPAYETSVKLTSGNTCGGHANILDAYGKEAGNCVTNYINN
jgi:hypothetical protein